MCGLAEHVGLSFKCHEYARTATTVDIAFDEVVSINHVRETLFGFCKALKVGIRREHSTTVDSPSCMWIDAAKPEAPPQPVVPWSISVPFWDDLHPGMKGRILREIVLIRHCESESNQKLMDGDAAAEQVVDVGLTKRGVEQAKHVQAVIAKLQDKNTQVWCSPQKRAADTCVPKYLNMHDLRERNYKRDLVLANGTTSPKETKLEFQERVTKVLMTVLDLGKGRDRLVLVTHSLWIREFLRQLQGADEDRSRQHFGNGAITVVQITRDDDGTEHYEIQLVGSVMHLPPHLRTGHHHALYYDV